MKTNFYQYDRKTKTAITLVLLVGSHLSFPSWCDRERVGRHLTHTHRQTKQNTGPELMSTAELPSVLQARPH